MCASRASIPSFRVSRPNLTMFHILQRANTEPSVTLPDEIRRDAKFDPRDADGTRINISPRLVSISRPNKTTGCFNSIAGELPYCLCPRRLLAGHECAVGILWLEWRHPCLSPDFYPTQPLRRYPVLYLHDGQNVFSSAGTNAALGWGNWELDKTADELSRAGKMQEIIMVAVDNSWNRREEYGGIHHQTNTPNNTAFENYTAFLLTELKPQIDREYRTLPDPAHTAAMGSSMGGLCSTVLAWEHPEVFGGAASLSGAHS